VCSSDLLKLLLDREEISWSSLIEETARQYASLSNPLKALVRDVNYLREIGAVVVHRDEQKRLTVAIRLDWPTVITETTFFEAANRLPKGKTFSFLSED
jgi:hypothetical protein